MTGGAWLRVQVRSAAMTDPVRRRFELELERLAQVDGQGFDPDEASLIVRLVGDAVKPEPCAGLDELWPYTRVFLTACLYVAVVDGRYTVEQARRISRLSTALGWSVNQLSDLEAEVLSRLESRGAQRMMPAS